MRRWMLWVVGALAVAGTAAPSASADFPEADSGYHSYAEVTSEAVQAVRDYPSLVRLVSLGKSYEGRDILALKVSDSVSVDEPEPEVLFDAGQHAREHLTVETAMYILKELTTSYATDARVRGLVDSREIWIVPSVNPDGAEFDVADGRYVGWRKNRQPNAGSADVGTDLNRNWGWQWGCCNGSSPFPAYENYRGAAPFSAPETQALRDFVLSRRVGGVQQIKTSIDFHSYGELVMWPYAYTEDDTAPGLTQEQRDAFAALGKSMAQSNGYTPQQTSDLYISDGNLRDWFWGSEGIFAYGFEIYPGPSSGDAGGFYPPDEIIATQTARNREAVLRLVEAADCPYRAGGLEAKYCGATPADPGGGGADSPPAAPPPAAPPPAAPPPALAAPPPPPGSGAGTDAGGEAATTVLATRAGLDSSGHVRLLVRCATAGATHCRGTIKLRARLPGSRKVVTIAKTNFAIRTGTGRITLRLGPKSARALRRRTAITVTALVTTHQDESGADTSSSARVKLVRSPAARDKRQARAASAVRQDL